MTCDNERRHLKRESEAMWHQFEASNIKENVLAIFMTTFHPNDPGIHPNDRGIHENFDYGVNLL